MNTGQIVLSAMCFAFAITASSFAKQTQSILGIAQGTWELDPNDNEDVGEFQCEQEPLKISIDIPAMRYKSILGENISVGAITEVGEKHFWLKYDGEERLDVHGQPVSWAFVLEDRNHFYWVRNDWLQDGGFENTTRRRRCADGEENLIS